MTTTLTILAEGKPALDFSGLIMMAIFMVILWVIMVRPQQKRAKELRMMQAALKKGDKVVTIGGMHATVNAVGDTTVSLRLADGVFVKYDKSAIATVTNKDKGDAKSAK